MARPIPVPAPVTSATLSLSFGIASDYKHTETTTMGRMTPVALGFRAHSGWAAVVAIAGPLGAPDVVDRSRIDLLDRTIPGAAQPYHAAAEMELKQAEKLIDRCVQSARRLAAKGLRDLIA